jgi:hypothetical protein
MQTDDTATEYDDEQGLCLMGRNINSLPAAGHLQRYLFDFANIVFDNTLM